MFPTNQIKRIKKCVVSFLISLMAAPVGAAVLDFNNATFPAWTEVTNGAEYISDVVVDGETVAQARVEMSGYSGIFDPTLTNVQMVGSMALGRQPGIYLAASRNPPGNDPASSVTFSLTIENVATGWQADGLSLTTLGAIIAAGSITSVTFDGLAGTVEDTENVLDLLAVAGPAGIPIASGGAIAFNTSNYDDVNGFSIAAHSLQWGLNLPQSTAFSVNYTSPGNVPRINVELFAFGAQFSRLPSPPPASVPIPLFASIFSALGLLILGVRGSARSRPVH